MLLLKPLYAALLALLLEPCCCCCCCCCCSTPAAVHAAAAAALLLLLHSHHLQHQQEQQHSLSFSPSLYLSLSCTRGLPSPGVGLLPICTCCSPAVYQENSSSSPAFCSPAFPEGKHACQHAHEHAHEHADQHADQTWIYYNISPYFLDVFTCNLPLMRGMQSQNRRPDDAWTSSGSHSLSDLISDLLCSLWIGWRGFLRSWAASNLNATPLCSLCRSRTCHPFA